MYAEISTRHQTTHADPTAVARWRDAPCSNHHHAPRWLRPWLLAEGSLTKMLVAVSGGDFRVERIAQDWRRPSLSEARLLGIAADQLCLVREVILWGCGEPWVYARSIMPARSLSGDLRRLRRLQNSSLGTLLFRYPQLHRTPFQLAPINGNSLPSRLRYDTELWGRRSRFELRRRALIVSEIFLPAFLTRQPVPRR